MCYTKGKQGAKHEDKDREDDSEGDAEDEDEDEDEGDVDDEEARQLLERIEVCADARIAVRGHGYGHLWGHVRRHAFRYVHRSARRHLLARVHGAYMRTRACTHAVRRRLSV